MEKRIRVMIDKKGNLSATTISGFKGEHTCEHAMEMLAMNCNGAVSASGAAAGRYDNDDPTAFVTENN